MCICIQFFIKMCSRPNSYSSWSTITIIRFSSEIEVNVIFSIQSSCILITANSMRTPGIAGTIFCTSWSYTSIISDKNGEFKYQHYWWVFQGMAHYGGFFVQVQLLNEDPPSPLGNAWHPLESGMHLRVEMKQIIQYAMMINLTDTLHNDTEFHNKMKLLLTTPKEQQRIVLFVLQWLKLSHLRLDPHKAASIPAWPNPWP